MALLSFSASPSKGNYTISHLDKATLFSLAPIASDSHWSNENAVSKLLVHYVSADSNQRKLLTFFIEDQDPQCAVYFSLVADDKFELSMITLIDHDGGSFTINRASLLDAIPTLSSMDVSLAP
jgi:hypothetical protein